MKMSWPRLIKEVLPVLVECIELLHGLHKAPSSEDEGLIHAKLLSRLALLREVGK